MENNINFINLMQFESAAEANHQPYETGLPWESWHNYQSMWYPQYQDTPHNGVAYQGPWLAADFPQQVDQAYAIQPSLNLEA